MLQNPDESKSGDESRRADEPGEFTRMFRTLREEPSASPAVGAVAETVSPAPAAPPSADGDGFTQIFQQIKRPTSAPPDLSGPAPPAAAGGGEFTQIFTGYQGAPEAPKAFIPAAAALVAPPAAVPQASEAAPGAFTQLFQKTIPSPEPTAAAQVPRAVEARPESRPPQQAGFGTAVGHEFGAPAPAGSFTEVFQAAPKQPAVSPGRLAEDTAAARFTAPPTPHPAASGESSFTQMFQALGETPAAREPVRPPAPGLVFGSGPMSPPAPAASAPAAAGAGEFTRLMQSLQQPGAAPSVSAQSPQAASLPPIFAQPSQAIGGSEFTRVMRGPAPASGVAHATVSAPQASSAPGMAIAPAKAEDRPKEPDAGKSKQMILLLVGLNVLLLLALIVLAVVLLRRH